MSRDANPPLRFVVLHHTGIDDPHFDLMYEKAPGSELVTFRFARWPATAPGQRLPDHRRAYLDYEGPISGNRGRVRRIARGSLTRDEAVGVVRLRDERGQSFTLPASWLDTAPESNGA